jgi:hypothetical protein
MKRCVPNVAREELFMEKRCAILATLDFRKEAEEKEALR